MTIQELADRAEVTTRTIRYYVEQGVLPPPERGRPAEYTEEHVARLALIKRLKEQYLPLEEIRDTMQRLSLAEVEALVEQHLPEQTTQKLDSATDYITTVLGRGMAREQMKQAAIPATDVSSQAHRPTTDNENRDNNQEAATEGLKKTLPAPASRLREATDPYTEPVPAPPVMPVAAPGSVAAPMPPAPMPAPAYSQPQPPAPSLASRLWSSVVGRRSSEREEGANIQPPPAWQRVQLGEGIELHHHVSSDARFNERVLRLIEAAHYILDTEPGNGD